jgi:hypothetical protein
MALLKTPWKLHLPGTTKPAGNNETLPVPEVHASSSWEPAGAGVLWLVVVAVLALFLQPLWSITVRVPASYDEGWNAYHAAAAIGGGMLYPPREALISNNYPPLSFFVVGALGHLVGDNIIAGRLIALASLLVVAGNIFLVPRALGAARAQSGFGALLFLAYAGAFFRGYVAMDEPQWFGHALMTGGLVIFLRLRGRIPATSLGLLAPALLVAGGFVKTNLVALPLAVLIWCAIYDRAELRRWLLVGLTLSAMIGGFYYLRFGADFISDVLFHPRPYSVIRLLIEARKSLSPLFLPIAGGLWLSVLAGRKPLVQLILLWALLAVMFGIAFAGGAGVSYNAFFDLAIALGVAMGLLLCELLRRGMGRLVVPIVMLLLALPPLTRVPGRIGQFVAYLSHDGEQREEGRKDIAFLAAQSGPVACEMLALCYWAGKADEIDFFNTEQKIIEGIVSSGSLMEKLDNRIYGAIALTTNAPREEQLPAAVMARMQVNYRIARVSANGWTILVPVHAAK